MNLNIDELLFNWRAVIGQTEKGTWPHSFALSIQRARRRADWQPTARQLAVIRLMVAELFTHGGNEMGDVIETVD